MSASPDRAVAGLIGGRYEITGLIAEGGMGSVFRARDTVLNRTVALKVLRAGVADQDFVARFREEATNAARLSHPNIVQVYDFGYEDGSPYMAMEFIDGQSLRDVLHGSGVLAPGAAARIAAQVAVALEQARKAGIVHRDVKPENILITTEGQVKMADFGLSRALAESRATQAEVLMGTAHYLAPEQVEGLPADHRADVYALGVVLYEMLTGRPPFGGDTPVVIAYKRVAEDVPSAMASNPSVPRELDRVVARATARAPEQRYQTAGDMVTDLRAAVPRSDTGDIGALVHHTQAIPIVGQETIALVKRGPRAAARRAVLRKRWVVLAALLAFTGSVIYTATSRLQTVEIPGDLVGMSQDAAGDRLRALGLDVEFTPQNSRTADAGVVIATDPPPGDPLRKGGLVTVVFSIGPKLVSVPSVDGLTYEKAEDLLRADGFSVLRVDVYHPTVKRLRVVSQDPDVGEAVVEGSKVTLTVSLGPELIPVPKVVGDMRDSAIEELELAGFETEVTERFDGKVPAGEVVEQSPKPGSMLEKGKTVELVVSKGPPPVKVPDLYCMSRKQAEDVLAAKGLSIEFSGRSPRVVDQDPAAGAEVPRGSTVTAFTGPGTRC